MDAMSRSLCHIVATEDAGSRLDALCAARGLYASRSAAARAIEEGRVFVNGATDAANAIADEASIADNPAAAATAWTALPTPTPSTETSPAARPWLMLRATI